VTSSRGVITSFAMVLLNRKIRSSISRSSSSMTPSRSPVSMMFWISSRVTYDDSIADRPPVIRLTRRVRWSKRTTSGKRTYSESFSGRAMRSAHDSVFSTAYDFGALSPNRSTRAVIPNVAAATACPWPNPK
jgi:hypothetical protein